MTSGREFRFEYRPSILRYGRGGVRHLQTELEHLGVDRALVITGSTVGNQSGVMEPVVDGLGEKLSGVFAETTPEKRFETARDGLESMAAHGADVIIGVGGGSSLDLAKIVSALSAVDQPAAIGRELAESGGINLPSGPLPPVVAVPTTLAGAELSSGAGVKLSLSSDIAHGPTEGTVIDSRLMPAVTVYDPALYATTPRPILAASAMNGFDKGIESLYARTATPVTDATASWGLELLSDGLERLATGSVDERVLEPVLHGMLLVQYGVTRPRETTLSIIHAFGHVLRRTFDIQQGTAHAIVAPHVLRYVFDAVDGRRDLLGTALGVADQPDTADAVVDAVGGLRDSLGLPSRLREIDGVEPADFEQLAAAIQADSLMDNAPRGLEPTVEELAEVLDTAY